MDENPRELIEKTEYAALDLFYWRLRLHYAGLPRAELVEKLAAVNSNIGTLALDDTLQGIMDRFLMMQTPASINITTPEDRAALGQLADYGQTVMNYMAERRNGLLASIKGDQGLESSVAIIDARIEKLKRLQEPIPSLRPLFEAPPAEEPTPRYGVTLQPAMG